MSALVVIDLTPTDKEKLGAYSAMVAETLISFGGEFIAKGAIETLHGESVFNTKVVIQFPDHDSAVNWYNSDACQQIIPTRELGMQSQFHLVG